jgi:nickel/cobalt homeostasis protein
MRKTLCYSMLIMALVSPQLWADNPWAGYRGVEKPHPHYTPSQAARSFAWQRPVQPQVTIHYQAPTTIIQNHNSYSWVNGQPAASISSSTYTFISDWQRLGLPAPPSGMYWIYENGRYALVPNR